MADEFLYSVRGPKSWMMMTSYELTDALKETDVALVPCGAIENHAGGLPLGQDNFQIEEITRRAVLKLAADGKKAIFGPTIPFGPISNRHFKGNIHIKPTTMILLIKEVCQNLFRDGIRNIILVKGHDMTLGALMVAARELADETDDALKVIVANWLPWVVKRLPEIFDKIPKGKRDGHGGAGEASRMLWQHPELCVQGAMKDYNVNATVSPTPFISPIVSGGGVYFPRKTTNTDPDFEGILGFPTIGTPEAGDLMYDEISGWIAAVAKEYCYGTPKTYNY
jgi:creatinine amidohydrolase